MVVARLGVGAGKFIGCFEEGVITSNSAAQDGGG